MCVFISLTVSDGRRSVKTSICAFVAELFFLKGAGESPIFILLLFCFYLNLRVCVVYKCLLSPKGLIAPAGNEIAVGCQ